MDKVYLDTENNGKPVWGDDFKVTLVGYKSNGAKVKQFHPEQTMEGWMKDTWGKQLISWGPTDIFDLTKSKCVLNPRETYDLKIPFSLYNENKRWSFHNALKEAGLRSHKYLTKEWKALGYDWDTVPMSYLKPYNYLDVHQMEPVHDWIKGKYNEKQDALMQRTMQALTQMMIRGVKIDEVRQELLIDNFREQVQKAREDLLEYAKIDWDSDEQTASVLLEHGYSLPLSDKGHFKTGKDILAGLPKDDLVLAIKKFRSIAPVYYTFLLGMKKNMYNGFLHPFHTFAVTGRYRTSKPNIQNFPKAKNSPLRKQIGSRFGTGGLLYPVDWSQLELYLIAIIYGIKNLQDELKAGIDIHARTAGQLNKLRPIAKNCNFGIFYGGTWSTLTRKYQVNAGLAKNFEKHIHSHYPELKQSYDRFHQEAYAGETTSIFGRTRRTSSVTKIANFNIQSPAGDLNKMMLIRAEELGVNYESAVAFDVHDELVFDVKKSEEKEYLDKVIKPCYNSINDQIERWFGFRFPLQLKYEVSKGPNYGSLKEVV